MYYSDNYGAYCPGDLEQNVKKCTIEGVWLSGKAPVLHTGDPAFDPPLVHDIFCFLFSSFEIFCLFFFLTEKTQKKNQKSLTRVKPPLPTDLVNVL